MKENIALVDYVGSKAGMDYYNIELLKALNKLGYKTFLFSNENIPENKEILSIQCFTPTTPSKNIGKVSDYFGGILKAGAKIKRNKIRKVIFHFFSATIKEYFAIRYFKLLGLEIYLIVHDVSALAHKDKQTIKQYLFTTADHLIVHNQYSRKEIEKIFDSNSNNKRKINVIKHGSFINLSLKYKQNREDAHHFLKLNPNKKYLLFFGQIKKVKGLDVLLNAMMHINPHICLIIAGKPWKDDFSKYQKIIEDNNLNQRIIQMIMYIPDSLRHTLFKATDALVIPYKEIFQSGVLIMGMSYGLPVIASDIEGNKESITNNVNGILFKTGNSLDLAKKINQLFLNDVVQKTISNNSTKTMINCNSWQHIAKEYENIL